MFDIGLPFQNTVLNIEVICNFASKLGKYKSIAKSVMIFIYTGKAYLYKMFAN